MFFFSFFLPKVCHDITRICEIVIKFLTASLNFNVLFALKKENLFSFT